MRTKDVEVLALFPGGRAVVRELTVGEMRRVRREAADNEELGLMILATALVEPRMTMPDLDALPVSALADLTRLTGAVLELQQPEKTEGDGPPA